jgi:hypothetical protein
VAVLVEAINVIVRNETIEDRYLGGMVQFGRERPNDTFCSDGLLTRLGFMAPPDVKAFVDRLQESGFELVSDGRFVDIAIVDQHRGATAECEWLGYGRHVRGFSYVFLAGTDPNGLVAVPNGWSLDSSLTKHHEFVSNENMASEMLFLRHEGSSDVYLNRRTGREVRVARASGGLPERLVN